MLEYMLALSRLLGPKERSQIEMTTVEMAACNEAMIDILDKLPEDLWIIAQRVNAPVAGGAVTLWRYT